MKLIAKSTALIFLVSLSTWSLAGSSCHPKRYRGYDLRLSDGNLTLAEKEQVVIGAFSNVSVSQWSYYYTSGAHLAGKNLSQAEWTRDKWSANGIPSALVAYDVFLNYPVSHYLSLKYPNGSSYKASLEEDVLEEDPTTSYPDRVPTFHGYSFTGEAEAEYVYVGLGRNTDFERLVELGVELKGKIALAKYGGPFRGLKVRNAQDFGMIGAVLFTDPGDDGDIIPEKGYAPYPDGPARNPSSVQRGSVVFLSTYPGDPTTPGYPSKPGVPRAPTDGITPHIPSLPISYREVAPLLQALNSHGISAAGVNISDWTGGLRGISYSTGPAPGAKISMGNFMEDMITPIWNVVGIINGTIEDEVIVIGNHRDAWIVGGASDPNSGSAVLIELSKAFGDLMKVGWKPKRTIVFASWDAEEPGLVGSTEWLEEFVTWAVPNVVAYLNLDVAVSGSQFQVAGVPELHDIIADVLKKVPSPKDSSKSVFDDWSKQIYVLGSGSDYTAFVQSGIASIDFGFSFSPGAPVYHYHSNYDSYHWMSTYGDPTWNHHVACGQFLGLLALNLAEADLLPLNVTAYSADLWTYYSELKTVIKNAGVDLELGLLAHAIGAFEKTAQIVEKAKLKANKGGHLEQAINNRLKSFERGFVSQGGLPGREFYKHLIYAPGLDTGYAPVTFPGITEAIKLGDVDTARRFVAKTSKAIWEATKILAFGPGELDQIF